MRNVRIALFLVLILFSGSVMGSQFAMSQDEEKNGLVYWIPLDQSIEQGLAAYLERTFAEAEEAGADAIVIEMDTLGGEVTAALSIGKLIGHSPTPVTIYIKGEAISAGSYIALNAETILMTASSAMGAAEPRVITGATADPKTVAAWASNMRAAAEAHGRNAEIAEAMVDRNIEIDGLTSKGELVSLSAKQAVEYGMADKIVKNEQDVLDEIGYPTAKVIHMSMTAAEKLARVITSPFVVPILFIVGLLGIGIEIFTPGFGLPGIVGLMAFGLYFFGHYVAGFAGNETVILFIVGIVLMIIELFIPGFGIFGIAGLICLIAGVALAAYDTVYGLASLLIAMVVTVIAMVVIGRRFAKRGTWQKFILSDTQANEAGYTSQVTRQELVGKRGETITPLRPSGAIQLEGKRYDVVTEGEFIMAGQPVEVIDVEGTRVVVRIADDTSP